MMLCLHASCTPHAWVSRDLGFPSIFVFNCYLNEILGPTLRGFHFILKADVRSSPSTGGPLSLLSTGARRLRSASEFITEDRPGHKPPVSSCNLFQ